MNTPHWVNWQSALYVIALGVTCVFLIPLTPWWWMAPLLGVAVPIVLPHIRARGPGTAHLPSRSDTDGSAGEPDHKDQILLALTEVCSLTPLVVASQTSLTLDEASSMLDQLDREGQIKRQIRDGALHYVLPRQEPESDRGPLKPSEGAIAVPTPNLVGAAIPDLDDPLSERETEVLRLLASGLTNAETARELFLSVGMVKSHSSNIYRKFGARSRAEAVARARQLHILS